MGVREEDQKGRRQGKSAEDWTEGKRKKKTEKVRMCLNKAGMKETQACI